MRRKHAGYTHKRTAMSCITSARFCYMGHINGVSQQKATRPVTHLTAEIPASFRQSHGPLSAVGVLVYGLANEMREVGYSLE